MGALDKANVINLSLSNVCATTLNILVYGKFCLPSLVQCVGKDCQF